jgi:hypothetical protein
MKTGDITGKGKGPRRSAVARGAVAEKADEGSEGCKTTRSDAEACFDVGPDGDLVSVVWSR